MIKINKIMRSRILAQKNDQSSLSKRLKSILKSGLLLEEDGIFLSFFKKNLKHITLENCGDNTGRECTINSFHISDYANGNLYIQAFQFIKHLYEMCKYYECRIILSDFSGDLTVRFHKLRSNETWLINDLETYLEEGVLYIDTKTTIDFAQTFELFQKEIS